MTLFSPRSVRVLPFVRCLAVFAVSFLLFQVAYRSIPDKANVAINQHLNAVPAAWLLQMFSPVEGVEVLGTTIRGAHASVNIRKGCEGFEVMGILIAAMLAYPMTWRLRLQGLVLGVLYIYLLNLIRIIGIFLTHVYKPEWAEAAHVTAGQTFIILLVVVFVFLWIEWVVGDAKSETAEARDEAG